MSCLPDRHERKNDARGESHSSLEYHPRDPLELEILQMEQCLREMPILQPKLPQSALFPSVSLLWTYPFLFLYMYMPGLLRQPSSRPTFDFVPLKLDLSQATRVVCLECKSGHLLVLFKSSWGSLLNSELRPRFLAWLLHTHTHTHTALLGLHHLHFFKTPSFLAFLNLLLLLKIPPTFLSGPVKPTPVFAPQYYMQPSSPLQGHLSEVSLSTALGRMDFYLLTFLYHGTYHILL